MKKLKEIFTTKRIILIMILLLFAMTIPNLNRPGISQTEAIVTMLCIDKEDDNIKSTATILTPGDSKTANLQMFSGSGQTLGESISNIALAIGKEMSFAQCEIMALGDEICKDGIIQTLDYMTRTRKVGRNAILINFSGDIDDFSKSIIALSSEKNLKLNDIINYDKRYFLAEKSNVELFYIGYYSDISLGIMPQLKIGNNQSDNAIEVSTSAESQLSSTNQSAGIQEQPKKYLVNDGTTNVFKNGKSALILTPEMIKKLNFLLDTEQRGDITISGVTDDLYTNATVVVEIIDKQVSKKASFKNGKPTYSIATEFTVNVEEVVDDSPERNMLRRNQEFLTPTLVNKLTEKIIADMQEVVNFCIEKKLDLVEVYKTFNRKHYKKWHKYLENTSTEDFLSGVEFKIDAKINSQY